MPRATHVAFGIALVACSHAAPRTEPPPVPPTQMTLPASLSASRAMILVGDMHGTREIPRFVGDLVAALAADHAVVLGLEFPVADTPSIDAYLASDGGAVAKQTLLADPWWTFAYQDGRRSVAMFDLVERVRVLRTGGARVELARFDATPPEGAAEDRDAAMAHNVAALRTAHPDASIVIYAGNLHTMRKGAAFRPGYTFMAGHLAAANIAFVSLAPRYADGSAWVCMDGEASHCGPRLMPGQSQDRGIHLDPSPDGNYDGWFGVGAITASPPAAFPELAASLPAKLAGMSNGSDAIRMRALRAAAGNDFATCNDEYALITEPNGEDAYNHACCLARLGRKDAAFERLDFAFAHGFTDYAHAGEDPDLASLHGDPRWPPKKP